MKRASIIIILFIIFANSLFAITSFDLIDKDYKNGNINERDMIYYKITALKNSQNLPLYLKGDTPIKSATPFILWLKKNENNFPFDLKSIITSLLDRPTGLIQTYNSTSGHFKIHYNLTGGDAVPNMDYVIRLGQYLDYSWSLIVDTLRYLQPPSDGTIGGDNRYDVYVMDIDAYGYTVSENDGPNPWGDYTSYIAIQNTFNGFPANTDPEGRVIGSQKVTCAHEFFHAVQMAYDGWEDVWFMEMSSVWMEECAYDTVNDYYNYLPTFFNNPDVSLFYVDGYHEYSSVMFPLYLTSKWNRNIMKPIWTRCISDDALPSIISTLDSMGVSYQNAFMEFLVWNFYTSTRSRTGFYSENNNYPGVHFEGSHSIFPANGSTIYPPNGGGSNYILFRPGSNVGSLQISVNCQRSVQWGIALTKIPITGEISTEYQILSTGGTINLTVPVFDRYSSVGLILSPINGGIETGYTYSYTATIAGNTYPAPINLTATSGMNSLVPLNWGVRSGFSPDSFVVYRKHSSEPSFTTITTVRDTFYNDHSVLNGQIYYYAVTAKYGSIESAFSDTMSAIPGGGAIVDSVWLKVDNNDGASYISDLSPIEEVAIRLIPDNPVYSYHLLKVSSTLYNFSEAVGESIRVKIYNINESSQPAELIYQSPVIWINTFYPNWFNVDMRSANITFPNNRGLLISIQFVSENLFGIPSPLTDTNFGIPRNINFYFTADNWLEHYSFWRFPNNMGYNMIRALAQRRTVGIDETEYIPKNLMVTKIFPNPFNSVVNIEVMNDELNKSSLNIDIYNLIGEKVKSIDKTQIVNNKIQWDAKNDNGMELPSGIYFLKLSNRINIITKQIIYLK